MLAATTRTVQFSSQVRRLVPTLILLSLLGCRAQEEPTPESPTDAPRRVLLVVLDAARPDRFSCYGYSRETTPNLDALAARGVVFRQHRTHHTATRSAVPSLLWSRYFIPPLLPVSAQIPLADTADLFRGPGDDAMSLPGLLAASGFRTVAISAHPWICAGNEGLGEFEEIINVTPDTSGAGLAYATAGPVVDTALAWLEAHSDEDTFVYLHLMDTHFPHVLGPEARTFLGEDAPTPLPDPLDERTMRELGRALPATERAQLDALVDGSLAHADHHLGRLFDSPGVARDKALIVVTADHGEHLLEVPGRIGHDGPWYDAVARVPLIVHYPPTLAPGVVHAATGAVDVAPTMVELLDVSVPRGVILDGTSLAGFTEDAPERNALAASGIVIGSEKCLFDDPRWPGLDLSSQRDVSSGERHDLAADPQERTDLWSTDQDARPACASTHFSLLWEKAERYLDSRRASPLRVPVALGVPALEMTPPTTPVPIEEDQPLAVALEERWRVVTCGKRTLLGTAGGESTVELSMSIPPGRYRLSLGALGVARVSAGGATRVSPALRAVSPSRPIPGRFDSAALGVVEVTDDGFLIQLEADPEGRPFLLRHVRFEPIPGPGGSPAPIPAGMDEQLRALGYVE